MSLSSASVLGKRRKLSSPKEDKQVNVEVLKYENDQLKETIKNLRGPIGRMKKLMHESFHTLFLSNMKEDEDLESFQKREPLATSLYQEYEDLFEDLEADYTSVLRKVYDIVYKEDEEEEDSMPLRVLLNWKFTMNTVTENSYVLYPSDFEGHTIKDGIVSWSTSHSRPVAWNIFLKELDRPVFYSQKYGGWIVSLRLHDYLVRLGAKEE